MIRSCVKKPRWSTPQATRKSATATSVAAKAKAGSAGGDELAGLTITLDVRFGAPASAGSEGDDDGEGEEPRNVGVEPVRDRKLETDEQGRGQRSQLERRLPPGEEVADDRAEQEQPDHDGLEPAQIRDPPCVVLTPAPDRERRVAPDLPAESSVPEDPRRMSWIVLEQKDR